MKWINTKFYAIILIITFISTFSAADSQQNSESRIIELNSPDVILPDKEISFSGTAEVQEDKEYKFNIVGKKIDSNQGHILIGQKNCKNVKECEIDFTTSDRQTIKSSFETTYGNNVTESKKTVIEARLLENGEIVDTVQNPVNIGSDRQQTQLEDEKNDEGSQEKDTPIEPEITEFSAPDSIVKGRDSKVRFTGTANVPEDQWYDITLLGKKQGSAESVYINTILCEKETVCEFNWSSSEKGEYLGFEAVFGENVTKSSKMYIEAELERSKKDKVVDTVSSSVDIKSEKSSLEIKKEKKETEEETGNNGSIISSVLSFIWPFS